MSRTWYFIHFNIDSFPFYVLPIQLERNHLNVGTCVLFCSSTSRQHVIVFGRIAKNISFFFYSDWADLQIIFFIPFEKISHDSFGISKGDSTRCNRKF